MILEGNWKEEKQLTVIKVRFRSQQTSLFFHPILNYLER